MRKGIKKKRSETMKLEQIRHTLLVGSEKGKESNKRIWDLREKRHKGVKKGEKAFLQPTLDGPDGPEWQLEWCRRAMWNAPLEK